jgi:hypothetical protein
VRIRSIKPEFYSSEDIAALDWPTRLLFIGLWSYVDDNGVGRDNEKLILADLFPLEDNPRDTLAIVSRGLQQLETQGMLARYTVDGKPFLYVNAWEKHQKIDRPNKPRYPRPDAENAVIRDTLATPSRGLQQNVASGTEEQRNRGTEEQEKTCPIPSDEPAPKVSGDFIDFYLAYPRHEGKGVAEKAYAKALKKTDAGTILAGAERYAADPNREAQYTKLPATWLNAEGWTDEPLPSRLPQRATTSEPRRNSSARYLAWSIRWPGSDD